MKSPEGRLPRLQRPGQGVARSTVFFLATCMLGNAAAAEGVMLATRHSAAGDAASTVASPEVSGDGILRTRIAFAYARAPLRLLTELQLEHRVVRQQSWLHAGASYALAHRVLVYAELPLLLDQSGAPAPDLTATVARPAASQALGDARLGTRVRIWSGYPYAWSVAAGAEMTLPSGDVDAYAGDEGLTGRAFAVVGAASSGLRWAVELGGFLRPSRTFPGVLPTRVGRSLTAAAVLQFPLDRGGRLWLGPELVTSSAVSEGTRLFDARSSFGHLLLGARYRPFAGALQATAAAGPGLGQAPGASDYQWIVALGWSPETPAPPPDQDADGIPDSTDMCLRLPGTPSRYALLHGCPPEPLDSDDDSIPDAFDACPRLAGEATARRLTHGCPPNLDGDADGVPDASDACPREAGPRSDVVEQNGCKAPPSASLSAEQIVISEQVQFETNTAHLLPTSAALLAAVADVLRRHPEVELVEVQGHTDNAGTPEHNAQLSRDRASAVVAALSGLGIEAGRLVARGYGQERPLADNADERGRARNRRVEFRVLRTRSGAREGSP